jgi:hypothetical protein
MNTIRIQLYRFFLLGALLSLALGLNYLSAWTGPTQSPPNGNVDAPINTGSTLQGKSGGLTLGSTLDIGSSLTVGGVPGDGPYLIDMGAATPGALAGIRFPDDTVQTTAAGGGGGMVPVGIGFVPASSNTANLGSDWTVVHFAGVDNDSDKGAAGGFIYNDGATTQANLYSSVYWGSFTLTTTSQCVAAGRSDDIFCAHYDGSGNLRIRTGTGVNVQYMKYNTN